MSALVYDILSGGVGFQESTHSVTVSSRLGQELRGLLWLESISQEWGYDSEGVQLSLMETISNERLTAKKL